ncbi:MAG TPA: IS30 family transposase [Pilimelia sp.]|nr:IS30 family transposase [Pilimelia sp.]
MLVAGPPRVSRERVRAFWRARLAGVCHAEAVALVGASESAGRHWVAESGGMIPDDLDGDRRTGRYLCEAERDEITAGWAAGLEKAEIARRLGRHPSTIGRELKRNQTVRRPVPEPREDGQPHRLGRVPGAKAAGIAPVHARLRYRTGVAQAKADERARRPKPRKLAECPELLAEVKAGLQARWSPQQISRTLARTYPDRAEMQVSHETIYQELYVQGRGELRRELTRCLRTGRALRRPRRMPDQRGQRRITDMVMISERPAEVADRAVPGHWEGDLIIGKDGGSAIGTLVERTTRFTMLLHLGRGRHGAEQVRDAMITTMRGLPTAVRRSVTWDQGIELARHAEITFALDMPIFFCDPHSPWQRGSNENTNGLLRQYFPKGTDLSGHSAEHLVAVAAELNARPRETLSWDSPAETLARLLSVPITTGGVATTP